MDHRQTALEIIDAVGGSGNIVASDVCMTRLRISLADEDKVDLDRLNAVRSVLGVTRRAGGGYEVIFGPTVIDDVYDDFVSIAGKGAIPDTQVAHERGRPPVSVCISPGQRQSYAAQADALSRILDELPHDDEGSAATAEHTGKRLLVINGANINMLGIREPEIYGHDDFEALVRTCKEVATEAGFIECRCYQSNHEGDLVDEIQHAYQRFDGIIINPGAYTHTSVAILDALKAVDIPAIEVHVSKLEDRDDFRQVSYVRAACFETIIGLGIEGYRKAANDMAEHLAHKD